MSDYVPSDLMKKILEHLPAESLLRFRRVCKWMNRFIDQSFIQGRLALQKPRFIALYKAREVHVLNPHAPWKEAALLARRSGSEPVNLVGTHHGIVCFYYCKTHFLLCNLLIRKSLIIPLPDFKRSVFTSDEFDNKQNDRSCVFSGFWIDPNTMDFGILLFRLLYDFSRSFVYLSDAILYSSNKQDGALWESMDADTHVWEPLLERKPWMNTPISEPPAVVRRDARFWTIYGDTELGFVRDPGFGTYLVIFDFVNKLFELFKGPNPEYRPRYLPVLSRWQATLSLVFVNEGNRCEVYFWRGADAWDKLRTFNLNVSDITRVLSMVEYEGKDTELLPELLENRRLLAASDPIDCPAFVLKAEILDESTFRVAYDYVASLLFPQE